MKIELWGKKIGSPGHVKIGTVEVPESLGYIYRLPIKQPISVMAVTETGNTPPFPTQDYREFMLAGGSMRAIDRLAGALPKYLEI